MIAAFLVYRLRSVLGRKTGDEQHRYNAFAQRQQRKPPASQTPQAPQAPDRVPAKDNVVPLPDQSPRSAQPPRGRTSVHAALTQIQIADPNFDPGAFLSGARAAFGMIVEAYAQGDTATLRPLLGDELYDEFSDAIRQRMNLHQTLETRIESFRDAEIVGARLEGRTAIVSVRFTTEQVVCLRDGTGEVIDGSPDERIDVTDIWTFSRNTRASDPTWMLISTEAPAQ
ncbi:MAG: Tim44/TimA family putative adaptor protein [Rhodospirillaceae bacterium]|nr:Tim44/TimA family putative adaptor protein [Rhodospirillaceae bacterium]